MKPLIAIVVPAYNEMKNIPALVEKLDEVLENSKYEFRYVFVDDGSKDGTAFTLKALAEKHRKVFYILLSRNFGKDEALKAGVDACHDAVAVITMDADLQHPPRLIPEMIANWEEGNDIVYAYRKEANPHTSFAHKIYSKWFYKLANMLSEVQLEQGISDFRLMDKKVVDNLISIEESGLFLRGLVKWVGYEQKGIEYMPDERFSGDTAYSKIALLKLAIKGMTAFSVKPLYLAVFLGFFFSLASLLYIPYVIISLIMKFSVSGWPSIICTIVFLGGLQLIILGIIGIYIGKIFIEVKGRPQYIIKTSNLDIQQKL
ncbi:MAG: glycosyltransferase family 2 protein [Bacteroidota bacterium]|nr:glycosyltransferase family 2 protein [Bacteroidota bacterium]